MVSVLVLSAVVVGSSPNLVKLRTMKLVLYILAATPLSMQHYGVRAKTGIRIGIMFLNGATCLPADCFCDLALIKIQLSMLV